MCTGTHDYIPALYVAEARLEFATVGGVAENVLNFQFPSEPTDSDLAQLGTDLGGWWHDLYRTVIGAGASLQKIVITNLTTESGGQIEYTTDLPSVGTHSGDGLPDNVTIAVKHVTVKRGRSYRGRSYVPGMTDAMLANSDTITTDYQTALGNVFEGLLTTPFTTHDEAFVIVSRCQHGSWLTNAVITAVTGSAVDPDIDSMRRRLKGRGI